MDFYKRFYGATPSLCNRGTIGTAILNISDTAQNIDMGVTFATAAKLDVTSSSVADASAGTGARTVMIYGLDFDGNPLVETLTMNGQTIVQTVESFWRIFGVKIVTAGTGRKNAGDIYIVKTGTGGTYTTGVPGTLTSLILKMLVGLNVATSGMWTCPRGFTYALDHGVVQSRVIAGRFQIWHGNERGAVVDLPTPVTDIDLAVSGPSTISFPPNFVLNELDDIYFKATMTAASGIISADICLRQLSPSWMR